MSFFKGKKKQVSVSENDKLRAEAHEKLEEAHERLDRVLVKLRRVRAIAIADPHKLAHDTTCQKCLKAKQK